MTRVPIAAGGDGAEAVLRRCLRLATATDTALREAAEASSLLAVPAGQAVFHRGDPGRSMFVVASGRIASRLRSAEGQIVDVGIAGPGDLFGYFEVFDGGPRDSEAVAVEPAAVLAIPPPFGLRLLTSGTPTLLGVIDDLLSIVRRQNRATGEKHFATVPARTAGLLLELADGRGRVVLGGSQSLLAHRVGTARQTLNRSLRAMAADGLIAVDAGGRGITILDARRLAELAEG